MTAITKLNTLATLLSASNIRARTAEFNATIAPPAPPEPKAEPTPEQVRLQAISDVLSGDNFGCQLANARKLVALIVGEELPEPTASPRRRRSTNVQHSYIVGSLVKARSHSDGSTEILLIRDLDSDGDGRVMQSDGTERSRLEGSYIAAQQAAGWLEPVTDEEVTAWLAEAGIVEAAPTA